MFVYILFNKERAMRKQTFQNYEDLLNKNYKDAVKTLLKKYGPATDDYFREASYYRFLNGEIKSPTKGKISRTAEGLYCHHIDENKFLNIANHDFILIQSIPFISQKRDRLVYCNLVEHFILHALISNETNCHFGFPGLKVFIKPSVEDWYINGITPDVPWQRRCFDESYITSSQAAALLNTIEERLTLTQKLLLKQKQVDKTQQKFEVNYPHLAKINFNILASRTQLITKLFDLKYHEQYQNKKEFIRATPTYTKSKLLKELDQIVEQSEDNMATSAVPHIQ
ncbi:conserved protein of unknown function [Oenococcus oeni]|uniref:Uncharacterized protein n=2 Tax=Oenococcus oeni TaxID=1247 RepID=A0AAQ2ZFM1_OENOE|nr:conserved protein of unknown function [Oenococcus oeni]